MKKSKLELMLPVLVALVAPVCCTFSQEDRQTVSGDSIKLPDGFEAERLYTVPKEQGSWVSMTTDPKGRLIASDQYGKLYRISVVGKSEVSVRAELIWLLGMHRDCCVHSTVCTWSPTDLTKTRLVCTGSETITATIGTTRWNCCVNWMGEANMGLMP